MSPPVDRPRACPRWSCPTRAGRPARCAVSRRRPLGSARPYLRHIPFEVPLGLAQRVAAELLEQGLRQHQGHHRFGDDPHGGHPRPIPPPRLGLPRPPPLQVPRPSRGHTRDHPPPPHPPPP